MQRERGHRKEWGLQGESQHDARFFSRMGDKFLFQGGESSLQVLLITEPPW